MTGINRLGDRSACDVAGGPCPLEVEPADAAVDIEDFSDEPEVGGGSGLEVFAVDLFEGYAPGGDFGVGEPSIGLDVDLAGGH